MYPDLTFDMPVLHGSHEYTLVPVAPAHQALVERFVGGEIDLGQLVGLLAAER